MIASARELSNGTVEITFPGEDDAGNTGDLSLVVESYEGTDFGVTWPELLKAAREDGQVELQDENR